MSQASTSPLPPPPPLPNSGGTGSGSSSSSSAGRSGGVGPFSRLFTGNGLSRTQNLLAWAVAFGGAAACYDADKKARQKVEEFRATDQQQWNQTVLSKLKSDEEKKRQSQLDMSNK